MASFFNIFVFLTFIIKYIFGQQHFGYSNNNNPFYSLGNTPQQQHFSSSFSPYGKSSYFYLNPYGNYGQSGYEGPPFGMNSYWQPGIATYSSGYGQTGRYNPVFQCFDQSSNCAIQANSGKCSYSPNTLANCPISCGLPCPTGGHLPEYNYDTGSNPLLQSPLSSGTYRDISSQQYNPQQLYSSNNAQLGYNDNYNQNNDFNNQNFPFPTTPNSSPFFCRDSHIFGCQNWAKLGFCQKVPEFMLNYCRSSCGVCNNFSSFSSTFKTPTNLKNNNNFIPQENLQFNNGGGFEGPQEPFGGISSNELLQEDNNGFLPYSHYYHLNSPLKTTASSFGVERKEKQQRLANEGFQQNKFLFNEDEEQQQIHPLSSTISNDFTKQTNLANLKPSQLSPSTQLPTQNSSVSKLIKMDDLLDINN